MSRKQVSTTIFSLFFFLLFNLHLQADDSFFGLPSPSEILLDAESEGLKITITSKNAKVLRTDISKIAKTDKYQAAFTMGRVFSVAGFSFKKLNNAMILKLAQKMYMGTASLKLPEVINNEITGYYQKMLKNPKWERAELMIFFTSARSSLMFLMKDESKIDKKAFPEVHSLGCALELGMWFQSLSLALENLSPEQSESYASVFMDSDILDYFDANLKKAIQFEKSPQFFKQLYSIHQKTLSILENESFNHKSFTALQTKLVEVIK